MFVLDVHINDRQIAFLRWVSNGCKDDHYYAEERWFITYANWAIRHRYVSHKEGKEPKYRLTAMGVALLRWVELEITAMRGQ